MSDDYNAIEFCKENMEDIHDYMDAIISSGYGWGDFQTESFNSFFKQYNKEQLTEIITGYYKRPNVEFGGDITTELDYMTSKIDMDWQFSFTPKQ